MVRYKKESMLHSQKHLKEAVSLFNCNLNHVFRLFDSILDPSVPNVEVTRMSLLCEEAPNPLVLDLQGESLPGLQCWVRSEE